ncbi:MAG: hypothetical protein K0R98_1402, partial [Rickettsiaceae bacterium]|nr:hypothetical protein [Rickettsiaceae bacterium]
MPTSESLNSIKGPPKVRDIAATASVLLPAIEAIDLVRQLKNHPETTQEKKQQYSTFCDLFYPYRNHIIKQVIGHPNGWLYIPNGAPNFIKELKNSLSSL